MKQYDVFISYRRADGEEYAKALYEYLAQKELRVFFDKEKMESGDYFDEQLKEAVTSAPHYILIATPLAFEFTDDEKTGKIDYVHEEIKHACSLMQKDREGRSIHVLSTKDVQYKEKQEWDKDIEDISLSTWQELTEDNAKLFDKIFRELTKVTKANIWHAAHHWLERSKNNDGRFSTLSIDERLFPNVKSDSKASFPIIVTEKTEGEEGAEKKALSLFDALKTDTKNFMLVGDGGIGKTTALVHIMENAYARNYEKNAQVPIFIELSGAPDTYGQLYSGGTSSFIRRSVYKQIRNDLSIKQTGQRQIRDIDEVFMLAPEIAVDPIVDLLTKQTASAEYLLLLDGLNEVSNAEVKDETGEVQGTVCGLVCKEIEMLMEKCPNVKVILTGRTDGGVSSDLYTKLELSGVDGETVSEYLKNSGVSETEAAEISGSEEMMNVLRIPLFLIMFARLKNKHDVSAAGEILRMFFSERKNELGEYSARLRARSVEKDVETAASARQKERLTAAMQCFIMDFILPEIASVMVKNDAFDIHTYLVEEIIKNVFTDFEDRERPYYRYGDDVRSEYLKDFNKPLIEVAKSFDNFSDRNEAIIDGCLKTLGILTRNLSKLSFIHQHIRDYFAAVSYVNTLTLAVYCNENIDNTLALNLVEFDFAENPIDLQVRRFIGEYLGEHRNAPRLENGEWEYTVPDEPCDRNLITRAVDIYRGVFDRKGGFALYNLIQILKGVRADLSGFDFSELDLTGVFLFGTRLSHSGLPAIFDNTLIRRHNLLPQWHSNNEINTVCFSPDSKELITASSDNTVKILDTKTYRVVASLNVKSGRNNSAVYSPDGSLILIKYSNKMGVVLDAKTLKIKAKLNKSYIDSKRFKRTEDCRRYNTAAFSPDGKLLAVAFEFPKIEIYDTDTFQVLAELDTQTYLTDEIVFSPDGSFIATLRRYGRIKIWNAKTFEEIAVPQISDLYLESAQFSPDGRLLLLIMDDGTVKLLDTKDFKEISAPEMQESIIKNAAFSPDGKVLVTSSSDFNSSTLWSAKTFKKIKTLNNRYVNINGYKTSIFSPDGKRLLLPNLNSIDIIDVKSGDTIKKLETYYLIWRALFSPDGKQIVTTDHPGRLTLWNAETFRESEHKKLYENKLNNVENAPDGNSITAISIIGLTAIDIDSFRITETVKSIAYFSFFTSFSPDGKTVLKAGETVEILNAETLEVTGKIEGHKDYVHAALFSPDGKMILTASSDGTAKVWNAETLEEVGTLEGHKDFLLSAAFSPDGNFIITASGDRTAKIWIVDGLLCIATINANEFLEYASFSPDSKYILTVSKYGKVKVWALGDVIMEDEPNEIAVLDCTDGREFGNVFDGKDSLEYALFTSDGRYIITATKQGEFKKWDAQTYECLKTIKLYPELMIKDCDFSRLHPDSDLTDKDRQLFYDHGAIV